jgi:hypothetical protein
MRRVLGVVNHSFGWSGLGVEHTTAAFGGPGKQHETAKEKTYRRQSESRRLGGQMLPSRDEKGTSVATPPRTNTSPMMRTEYRPAPARLRCAQRVEHQCRGYRWCHEWRNNSCRFWIDWSGSRRAHGGALGQPDGACVLPSTGEPSVAGPARNAALGHWTCCRSQVPGLSSPPR